MNSMMSCAAALTLALIAGAADAASLELKNIAARVTVVPEARNDIKVEIESSNPKLPVTVRTFAGRTIVDGGLGRRLRGCSGEGESSQVHVTSVGDIGWNELPRIVVRTPRDADIVAGGAIWGSVGRSASLNLGVAGCGTWTLANVAGDLKLSQAGRVDMRAGSAREAKVRVAGTGDIGLGAIRGPLEVDIAGSSNLTAASVSDTLDIHMAGRGDIKVADGHVGLAMVKIAGNGNVDFGGSADRLKVRIAGRGDIHVREVKEPVSKLIMGTGRVVVGP